MKSTSHPQRGVENTVADERRTVHHAEPMTAFETSCDARTTAVPDFIDVTEHIADAVARSGITEGRATVFAPDESCSIMINERESGLLEDLKRTIARLASGNGSRRNPALGSSSVVLPVTGGKLRLGTWQRVLLVELGHPAHRAVAVHVIGK